MKHPRRFRLMGQTFRLESVDVTQQLWTERHRAHLSEAGGVTALGGTEVSVQRIGIRKGQGFHAERSTVLHEAIHAIELLTGHSVESWTDDAGKARHAYIGALETGLLDLLRSNPALVAYLTEREP